MILIKSLHTLDVFFLIICTHGFKWRLKVTVLTCDLFACNLCVCTKSH